MPKTTSSELGMRCIYCFANASPRNIWPSFPSRQCPPFPVPTESPRAAVCECARGVILYYLVLGYLFKFKKAVKSHEMWRKATENAISDLQWPPPPKKKGLTCNFECLHCFKFLRILCQIEGVRRGTSANWRK